MKKTLLIVLFVVVSVATTWILVQRLAIPLEAREFERLMADPPPMWSKERKLAEEAARKLRDKYVNLKSLSFDLEAHEIPKYVVATAKVTMRPGFFTTKASFDGQLVWDLMFKGGKFYEYKFPYRGAPDERLVYEVVDDPDGPGHIRSSEGALYRHGCMIGRMLSTWVGPESEQILLFQERLQESWNIGRATVDGFPCLVFLYVFPHIKGGEKYYVDEESLLIRRTITYTSGSLKYWRRWTRTVISTYHNIVAEDSVIDEGR